jgi:hypothetical protein
LRPTRTLNINGLPLHVMPQLGEVNQPDEPPKG